jgi:hypothetical protein
LFHDSLKAGIECDGEYILAENSFKTARDMKLVGKQHGARIRRPPQDGLVIVVPGENTVAVRFEETFRTEITSYGE